jgi:hypothetical protein
MLEDRRRYYAIGLGIGLVVMAVLAFGPRFGLIPSQTPEQRVAADIAIIAKEPWDSVHVVSVEIMGPSRNPTDAILHGVRPNGTLVRVHFAADSPYSSSTAVQSLAQSPPEDRNAEILMVPRSLVHSRYRDRFSASATHAGVAIFAGTRAQDRIEGELAPTVEPATHDG